ncbi:hypothetical protein D9611_001846 [Ephemerocybe angulata]|uniref:Uncharacterized protein n=1 Tax=Ephemerocybe angulata TaxID=980116 RepID=A0A8H5CJ86_9AGAR|nr:hypothetical protein D9611_001846 [Tulosesus angulatus]
MDTVARPTHPTRANREDLWVVTKTLTLRGPVMHPYIAFHCLGHDLEKGASANKVHRLSIAREQYSGEQNKKKMGLGYEEMIHELLV